jgi:hypothetical protein
MDRVITMKKDIIIAVIWLALAIAGLASLALLELLVGEFGMILLSFVGLIYIGRKFYIDLFVDVVDE